MADAIGLTASLVTLVATVYNSCQTLYNLSSGIRDAPRHIQILAQDLEDYYHVLGSLQSLLSDEDFQLKASHVSTSKDLARVLESSLAVFKDLNTILGTYKVFGSSLSIGKRARWRWNFKEKEVEDLRRSLNAQKLTLNTAISVANLYDLSSSNTNSDRIVSDVAENIHDLQERLAIMQLEMEDVRAAQLPVAPRLVDIESALLRTDYNFALRHYLGDTRSEGTITPSPSMQVSSLCGSNSIMVSTLYHTALTHVDRASDLAVSSVGFGTEIARKFDSYDRVTSLTVHGAPGHTPLNFTVPADYGIVELRKIVAGRLQLLGQDPQEFRLRYEGRILQETYTLRTCGIHYRAFLDYEATGAQFRRFTNLPDDHP